MASDWDMEHVFSPCWRVVGHGAGVGLRKGGVGDILGKCWNDTPKAHIVYLGFYRDTD